MTDEEFFDEIAELVSDFVVEVRNLIKHERPIPVSETKVVWKNMTKRALNLLQEN